MRTKGAIAEQPRCFSYIRFTTPEQLKGHSLQRQLELSEAYAKEKGLFLDDSLNMRDLGISAFKGSNRDKGALGEFLKLIKADKIPKGSILIVESLDRLSREQVFDALSQFMDIIRSGITVVTLADRTEYTRDSINANLGMQLMFSLLTIGRAHEESLMKSKRLSSAWKAKRENLTQKKLTGKCPSWLKLNDDKKSFSKIPERCRVVENIFKMSASRTGTESIARSLNRENGSWIPEMKRGNKIIQTGWRKSYVSKILHNRAVIGEFQPMTGSGTNRKPEGESISNYYPAIIPEGLFYEVQRPDQKIIGGRNGVISNLFGGLAKCGYCGKPMRFINKGKPPKGGTYLVCDGAVMHSTDCKRHTWRYDEIQELILSYCKGLEVADLIGKERQDTELITLNDQLSVIVGKLNKIKKGISNIQDQIADESNKLVRQSLSERLGTMLLEEKTLDDEKQQVNQSIRKLNTYVEDTKVQIANLNELMSFLQTEQGENLIDVRKRLRHKLRILIASIKIYPMGSTFSELERKDRRELLINFKSGSYRILSPSSDTVLRTAYEHEKGRTYFFSKDSQGLPDVDITVDEEEEEAKSQELGERVNERIAKRNRTRVRRVI